MTTIVVSTDVNGSFSVPDGGTNTDTSLTLIGRGTSGYGQIVANNTIQQLQNFASPTAPTTPLVGQLWYNTNNSVIEFYMGSWSAVAQASDLANYAPLAAFNTISAEVTNLMANAVTTATLSNYVTQAELYSGAGATAVSVTAGGTGLTAVGTAGFVLTVNSTATGYTFTDPTTFIPSYANLMRTNQTNVPTVTNTYNLGSSSAMFANMYATTFQGTATSAQYADVAERYESDTVLESGDVVVLGGEKEITLSSTANSEDVFGVISTSPGYMMNSNAGDDTTHPYVALAGRIPVKVLGPVKKGQRLVTSDTPGVAQAAGEDFTTFMVIGRALCTKTSTDIGLVEVVVGVK
jgi:hypothetical protein